MLKKLCLLSVLFNFLSCTATSDCTSYKNGKFYMYAGDSKDKILIDRHDSIQIETNSRTGEVKKGRVTWVNPCEYKIIGITDNVVFKDGVDSFLSVTPIHVVITNTAKDYYVFRVRLDSADKHLEYRDTVRVLN